MEVPKQQTIDYDILVAVMEVAAAQDTRLVAAMSRTCRRLHTESIKWLLSREVLLGWESDLISFCNFMLADQTNHRFSIWYGRFVLYMGTISMEASSLLCDVLSRCGNSHVTDLQLWDATRLLQSDPRLSSAFASFTRLDFLYIDLQRGDREGTRFLRLLRSPLKSVRLQLPTFTYTQRAGSESRVIYARGADPFWLLSKLNASLERVEVDGDITTGAYKQQFLHITELSLEQEIPLVRPLIASLPNLRVLEFTAIHRMRLRDNLYTMRGFVGKNFNTRECREINLRDQRTYGAWTTLDMLAAPTITAYGAALLSRINRLHLLGCKGRPSIELSMMLRVIQEARPTHLRLVLDMQEVEYIASVARLPAAALLSTFELRLLSRNETSEFNSFFVSRTIL